MVPRTSAAPRRVAVVGSGVAGLTAAYVASRTAHVTLYEADDRLGGHADTHTVGEKRPDGSEHELRIAALRSAAASASRFL